MFIMLLVQVGLLIYAIKMFKTPKQEIKQQTVEEVTKSLFDMNDKEQKKQYDELMRAWNYNGRKKELVDEQ